MHNHSATHPVKCIFGFVLFAILFVPNSFAQGSSSSMDEEEITVNVTLKRPPPSCSFVAPPDPLEYGVLRLPDSGNGTAVFDPTDLGGSFSYKDESDNDLPYSGSPSIGKLSVIASNVSSITVQTWERGALIRSSSNLCDLNRESDEHGKCGLSHHLRLAYSMTYSNGDPRSEWTTRGVNGAYPHDWDDAIHATLDYQIGGRLLVEEDTPPGIYTYEFDVQIMCSS